MDAIELRICWNQLLAIANESARALRRVAFSPIVRESGDIGVAICDVSGRLIANAHSAAPGHMNTISNGVVAFSERFPLDSMQPGDVFITNNPWLGNGHLFDITLAAPIFYKGKPIAFLGSNIHHTDVGGYGVGVGARDVHEEGLHIPPMRLMAAGRRNEALFQIIEANVRDPKSVFGDLMAQRSGIEIGGRQLAEFCDRFGLSDLDELFGLILQRSEAATREAIRKLPSGEYFGATEFDAPDNEIITLKVRVTVDADKGEICADFAGSSPSSRLAINVVAPYAHAYVRYALRCLLNPDLPNNHGSLAPFAFSAPEGCILNAKYPAPVTSRHLVALNIPMAINHALLPVFPDKVVAESTAGAWGVQVGGLDADGAPFISSAFTMCGGMGARRDKDGIAATSYPGGITATPLEILEALVPIHFTRKELRRGTGGPGRHRGGDGQVLAFHMRTETPWTLNASMNKIDMGPGGIAGGGNGAPGRFLVNGEPAPYGRKLTLDPRDEVVFETPGGGGYGPEQAAEVQG